ncbi:MAG TPA: hypothetical protein VGD69_00910 [Herpetosiphonaceae bacterium]
MIEQLREGLEVQSVDGVVLGKINEVWWGSLPSGSVVPGVEETCFSIKQGMLFGRTQIYVPCSAVADVSETVVTLNLDAETIATKPWNTRPAWIPMEAEVSTVKVQDSDYIV